MGWKTIHGRQYYYASVRDGSTVRSIYIGRELGESAAQIIREDQRERELRRTEEREEREEWDEVENAVDDLIASTRHAAEELLRLNGFHQHHRSEWRKRRVKRES